MCAFDSTRGRVRGAAVCAVMLALSLAAPDPARLLAADLLAGGSDPGHATGFRPRRTAQLGGRHPRSAARGAVSRDAGPLVPQPLLAAGPAPGRGGAAPAPAGIELRSTRMRGTISDVAGRRLSQFDLASVPGAQFVLYPRLPAGFLGLAQMELIWLADDRVIAQQRHKFRVAAFSEPVACSGRIDLRVPNESRVVETAVPVTVGVPFPRGVLSDVSHLRLVDESGREIRSR